MNISKNKTKVVTKKEKASKVEVEPKSKKELTITMFCMMGFITLFSILNVMDLYFSANIMALPIFIGVALIFLIPFTLMVLEFTSMKKAEGSQSGLNKWVELSTTKKLAFMTAFSYWISRLPYLALAVIKLVTYASFGITGSDAASKTQLFLHILPWVAIATLALMSYIATRNLSLLGKFAKISGMFSIILIVLFFVGSFAGLVGGANIRPNDPPFGGDNIWGEKISPGGVFDIVMMITVITWFIKSVDGMQGFSVYQDEVQGGRKGFVRGMLILLVAIIFVHLFGILLMEVFSPEHNPDSSLLTVFFYTYANMFKWIFGGDKDTIIRIMFHVFGIALFILSFTAYLLWIGISVRILVQEAPDKLFPDRITKVNENNVPATFTWLQFMFVVPFILLVSYTGGSGGEIPSTLNTISGVIKLLPLILIIFAYLQLRMNREWEERSFKMGNRIFGIFISMLNILALMVVFVFAVKGTHDELWIGIVADLVTIIISMGSIIGLLRLYEIKMTTIEIAKNKNIKEDSILNHYSIIYRIKLLFMSKDNIEKQEHIKNVDIWKQQISIGEVKEIIKNKKTTQKKIDNDNMTIWKNEKQNKFKLKKLQKRN